MSKIALLIGVSQYGEGFSPLPGAEKDIEIVKGILKDPQRGGFLEENIKTLKNPNLQIIREEIEKLFSGRNQEDLILLYFSGHGIKDTFGHLYFSTHQTRKDSRGELSKATALEVDYVRNIINNSLPQPKQKIIILDCCFSGAFAEDLLSKDDGSVNIEEEFGIQKEIEGLVILTSSTSTQLSFQDTKEGVSIYTRYLVEGIKTGAADEDNDGWISVRELHSYTQKRVRVVNPKMRPRIYAHGGGFDIRLAKAPPLDPLLEYRKEAARWAECEEFSQAALSVLEERKKNLRITSEQANQIHDEVLKPFQEYNGKLQKYEDVLRESIQDNSYTNPATQSALRRLQELLNLLEEDVDRIHKKVRKPQAFHRLGRKSMDFIKNLFLLRSASNDSASNRYKRTTQFQLLQFNRNLLGLVAFTGFESALIVVALTSLFGKSLSDFWLWLIVILTLVLLQSRRMIQNRNIPIILSITLFSIIYFQSLNSVFDGFGSENWILVLLLASLSSAFLVTLTLLSWLLYQLIS